MKVSVAEARNDLTKLIKKAEKEEIIVTRHGKPAVVLLSYEEYERWRRIRSYLNMVRISKSLKGSGISATELYEESRRELEERY